MTPTRNAEPVQARPLERGDARVVAAASVQHRALARAVHPLIAPEASVESLEARIVELTGGDEQVAVKVVTAAGEVRAAAIGVVARPEQDSPEDIMSPALTITVNPGFLVAPYPGHEEAASVAAALLDGLDAEAARFAARHVVLPLVPHLHWLEPHLRERGYVACLREAVRDASPLEAPARRAAPPVLCRRARPADEDALAALHVEEVAFAFAHHPLDAASWSAASASAFEGAFRALLHREWNSEGDGAPVTVVAESDGGVVGLAQCRALRQPFAPAMLQTGVYGAIENVVVDEAHRGRGVARALVNAALDALAPSGVIGLRLTFVAANPLAARAWPALGFVPWLTAYERRL